MKFWGIAKLFTVSFLRHGSRRQAYAQHAVESAPMPNKSGAINGFRPFKSMRLAFLRGDMHWVLREPGPKSASEKVSFGGLRLSPHQKAD